MANSDLTGSLYEARPVHPIDPLSQSRQREALAFGLRLGERELKGAQTELRIAERAEREDGFTGAHYARERHAVILQHVETLRAIVAGMRI